MSIDEIDVAGILRDFFRSCEAARDVGVPLYAVVNGDATAPKDWVLDPETMYYLPPNFGFTPTLQ